MNIENQIHKTKRELFLLVKLKVAISERERVLLRLLDLQESPDTLKSMDVYTIARALTLGSEELEVDEKFQGKGDDKTNTKK